MEAIKRMYRSGLYSFKGMYGFLRPSIYILVKVINPIFEVIFFSLVAKHAYGGQDITPYILGNAFVLCSSNAFFGVGTIQIIEREYGTLKNIIASPCNKFSSFVSKSLFHIVDGGITVIIGLITGMLIFNLRIPVNILPQFIIILIAAMFSACAMGLLMGSIGLITRDINLLLNVASMILMALSGVNFPIDRLPTVLQYISKILPLTNALQASKELIYNGYAAMDTAIILIFKEFALGIMYCIVAYLVLKSMETMAKRKATIEIY